MQLGSPLQNLSEAGTVAAKVEKRQFTAQRVGDGTDGGGACQIHRPLANSLDRTN